MKIGLGTAQFGMNYGVSNREGRPDDAGLAEILTTARRLGIDLLDTAPDYGDSESRIGALGIDGDRFLVVTKVPPGSRPAASIPESLRRLCRAKIYGCLLHRAPDLQGPRGESIAAELMDARERGVVQKIGISVYGPAELEAALEVLKPDIVQLPANVFDQRLVRGGHVRDLHRMGVEVHARSVFLQGLLLMDPAALPKGLAVAREALLSFDHSCRAAGCTRLEGALAYVKSVPEFDRVLVGVARRSELEEIAGAAHRTVAMDFAAQAVDDERIVVPSNWK